MNRQQTLSIMVNEEDHLRMQAIRVGFQLHNAYATLEKVDGELEELLDFAFNEQLGYLTACPTNVGTGMRASAMLHLPALVLKEEINKVIQSVNKIGLAVRGLYGEGTEAMGNLFQISNQTTLGEKEEDIIGRLAKVIEKIIEAEQNMRETLMQSHQTMLADQVGRAYGILSNAHSMTSKEALNLLSVIRMSVDLAILPSACRLPVDELFMETQPAHLQKNSPQPKLSAEERDALRADIVRGKLRGFPAPDLSKVLPAGEPRGRPAGTGPRGEGIEPRQFLPPPRALNSNHREKPRFRGVVPLGHPPRRLFALTIGTPYVSPCPGAAAGGFPSNDEQLYPESATGLSPSPQGGRPLQPQLRRHGASLARADQARSRRGGQRVAENGPGPRHRPR